MIFSTSTFYPPRPYTFPLTSSLPRPPPLLISFLPLFSFYHPSFPLILPSIPSPLLSHSPSRLVLILFSSSANLQILLLISSSPRSPSFILLFLFFLHLFVLSYFYALPPKLSLLFFAFNTSSSISCRPLIARYVEE